MNHRLIEGLCLPFFIVAFWFIGSGLELWNEFIIPSPQKTWQSAQFLLSEGILTSHVLVSLYRVFAGFLLAFFLAFPLGILTGMKPKVLGYLEPILELIRHIPPLATVPMLILWFGIGETPKLVIIILTTFFPIFLNTLNGVVHCDKKLLEVGQSFGFNSRDKFMKIILPASLPNILIGMRIGLGYSWRALMGAELIAASAGIGFMINEATHLSRPDIIIVGILTIGIIGTVSDHLFFRILHRFVPWKDEKEVQNGGG
ncbi:MAG: ABC transporter permease [Peptococcaceae bacterium]|nr:ABC transporter permease [Peptococcaceae bacterium]